MAFIDNQDEDLQNQQNQAPQTGSGSSIVSSSPGSGSSSSPASGGSGGNPGWTNIQAYLQANQGDTGSSKALNDTVGSQFGQERNAFQNDSQNFLSGAKKQVDDSKVSTDQADQYINQAGSMYDYNGNKSDQYKAITDKLQNALTGQYAGPTDYNYGFSDKTQNYGHDLNDSASFDTLMKDVYTNSAKTPLTSGQYQLQKQFDVNNQALNDTRKNLSDQYGQLTNDRDKTVQDTTSALGGLEQNYRENQNNLHDYLGKQANSYDTKEAQDEADARSAYQNSFKNNRTGVAMAVMPTASQYTAGPSYYGARGVYDNNMTPQELQNEQNLRSTPLNSGDYYYIFNNHAPNDQQVWRDEANNFKRNTGVLNDWYANQDSKYADTGDQQKRSYNAIQDFLNSNNARKEQGFKVRG